MDMDDDDAFLYGDDSGAQETSNTGNTQVTEQKPKVEETSTNQAPAPMAGVSAAMAASLAAYGIDPSTAVVEQAPEDGMVEEEDVEEDDDDSSDDDDDDIKLVLTGPANRVDLRKSQQQQSNVIGIGKWAHTSTGNAPVPAAPSQPTPTKTVSATPIPNQTTEYNPHARPSATPNPLQNPPIPPSGGASTPTTVQPPPTNGGAPGTQQLPPSSLPPVTAGSTHPKIDPSNPTGIIPSTGTSVYEIDLNQFEGSGQPWRRPGSDLTDWFNFGFDEVTYPKFLQFRADMEAGRQALANPLGQMPNDLPGLLHLNMQIPQQNMGMMNGGFNPQQLQQMQQQMMMGQGMDGMMGMQQQPPQMQQQMLQQNQQNQQTQQNQQNHQNQQQQQQPQRQQMNRPSATPAPAGPAPNEEGDQETVKQEEPDVLSDMAGQDGLNPMAMQGQPGFRGRGMGMRGMPTRGVAMRGRGAIAPLGPRGVNALIGNVPKGPKAGRFKDKDRVDPSSSTTGLDYGDSVSSSKSRSASPVKQSTSTSRRQHERSYSAESRSRSRSARSRSYSRSPSRSRSPTPPRREKEKEREKDKSRSKRDREKSSTSSRRDKDKEREGGSSSRRDKEREKEKDGSSSKRKREQPGLGPGGWEDDGEREEVRRGSRRRRSESEEDVKPSRRRR